MTYSGKANTRAVGNLEGKGRPSDILKVASSNQQTGILILVVGELVENVTLVTVACFDDIEIGGVTQHMGWFKNHSARNDNVLPSLSKRNFKSRQEALVPQRPGARSQAILKDNKHLIGLKAVVFMERGVALDSRRIFLHSTPKDSETKKACESHPPKGTRRNDDTSGRPRRTGGRSST